MGRRLLPTSFPALLLLAAAGPVRAVTFDDPLTFSVKRTWTAAALGIPSRPGGMLFSADGLFLYVVSTADDANINALYRVDVTRAPGTNEVTDLTGPAIKVFDGDATLPGLDAGLEIGPGGTLFYSYFDSNRLGERPNGIGGASETVYDMAPLGTPISIDGIQFSPFRTDPSTGFGRMQISTGYLRNLFEVPLGPETPPGSGLFPPGPGTVTPFARLPQEAVAGIHYVPAGMFTGDLLYAATDPGELRVLTIDPATGLPVDAETELPTLGTTNPIDVRLASGLEGAAGVGGGPLGLEFDTLATTRDLFVSTLDGAPPNSILQVGGFDVTTTTTTTTLPPGCVPGATFTAIGCRLDGLITTVTVSTDLGTLQPRLLKKAMRARDRVATSETRVGEGRRRPARKALGGALRTLAAFRRKLASAAGKRLPPDLRATLDGEAAAIADGVRALRGTL